MKNECEGGRQERKKERIKKVKERKEDKEKKENERERQCDVMRIRKNLNS